MKAVVENVSNVTSELEIADPNDRGSPPRIRVRGRRRGTSGGRLDSWWTSSEPIFERPCASKTRTCTDVEHKNAASTSTRVARSFSR